MEQSNIRNIWNNHVDRLIIKKLAMDAIIYTRVFN